MDLSFIQENFQLIAIGGAFTAVLLLSAAIPQIRRKIGVEFTLFPPFIKPYIKFEYGEFLKLISAVPEIATVDEAVTRMVSQRIRTDFSDYGAHLILRYGSSVRFETPRDFDYLVLLIGHSEKEKRRELSEGSSFRSPERAPLVDINYRDYNSFAFALVSGMPYEHSVMYHHSYVSGDLDYLKWLRVLAANINIDRDYMVKTLSERTQVFKDTIDGDLIAGTSYRTIIALYFFASTLVQIPYCQALPPVCRSAQVAPIARPENLLSMISDTRIKQAFQRIYQYYKRELSIGSDFDFEFRSLYETMLTYAKEVLS